VGSLLFADPQVSARRSHPTARSGHGIEFIRFDMSEYMERHTVSRLIGAPPGYVGFDQGGLLTRPSPSTRIACCLLDEIEKAHPDVFNLLLQVMDMHADRQQRPQGRLPSRHHRHDDQRRCAGDEPSLDRLRPADNATDGMEAVRRLFSPEFRNRLDATIQFAPLDAATIERVSTSF